MIINNQQSKVNNNKTDWTFNVPLLDVGLNK